MIRHVSSILCLAALAVATGCGSAPDPSSEQAWNPRLRSFPFSGVVDPASGRIQISAGPQAALVTLPEDKDGVPFSAAANTAEIYGPSVTFPSGGNGYPAGCSTSSPWAMNAPVTVTSGFAAQQLRNVYARITTLTAGPTFCTVASAGNFGGTLGTFGSGYKGLYLYAPLDFGTAVASGNLIASSPSRTLTWALNLPNNLPFAFAGDLWAEVIPEPPAITVDKPFDAATNTITGGSPNFSILFGWAPDVRASGTDLGNLGIVTPSTANSTWILERCNPYPGTFNGACSSNGLTPPTTVVTTGIAPGSQSYSFKVVGNGVDQNFWWRTTVVHQYSLPGATAPLTTTNTLVFHVIR